MCYYIIIQNMSILDIIRKRLFLRNCVRYRKIIYSSIKYTYFFAILIVIILALVCL